jgi:hypothetical protein
MNASEHGEIDRERLRVEATRLHLRYSREAVEALGLCPWAEAAREAGRVEVCVVLGSQPDGPAALAAIDAVAARAEIDVGFVIFPELDLDRLAFSHFVANVRERDAARRPLGQAPLAMADFHPNAEADTRAAQRLVPFVRRTPDPTIQLVRRSALESVRMTEAQGTSFFDASRVSLEALLEAAAPTPPLSERIARQNLRAIEKLGVAQVEEIFRDIARDRDASYAALGVPLPAWAKARTRDSTPPT